MVAHVDLNDTASGSSCFCSDYHAGAGEETGCGTYGNSHLRMSRSRHSAVSTWTRTCY